MRIIIAFQPKLNSSISSTRLDRELLGHPERTTVTGNDGQTQVKTKETVQSRVIAVNCRMRRSRKGKKKKNKRRKKKKKSKNSESRTTETY